MSGYSRDRFLEEFELSLDKEFEWNGRIAEWAPGHDRPFFWGDEDDRILPGDDDDDSKSTRNSSVSALTSDGRFLAVSSNAVIEIYDMQSLALCSRIVGHEGNIGNMFFVNASKGGPQGCEYDYTLFSDGAAVSGSDSQIYTWHIDADGALRRDQRIAPIPVNLLSDKAVEAVSDSLTSDHGLGSEELEKIRHKFLETLKAADARNRVKHLPTHAGHFPSFNTQPASHSGARILHIAQGQTTQHGMRPPDELPHIVITEVATGEVHCRLRGHQDAIMWAGWSLDDKHVATASWDQTFSLWDAETGERRHVIGKTGGQNWAGAFLPDGQHVILSGGQPVEVGIYNIKTGEKVTHLEPPENVKLDHWMRYFTVHPTRNLIVMQNRLTLLAWSPAVAQPSPTPAKVEEIFALTPDPDRLKNVFNSVYTIDWADNGNKLIAKGTDSTSYVWDLEKGWKWRFQRPKGRLFQSSGGDVHFINRNDAEWVASLDGDARVRFWKL